jgi:hypothetical protein
MGFNLTVFDNIVSFAPLFLHVPSPSLSTTHTYFQIKNGKNLEEDNTYPIALLEKFGFLQQILFHLPASSKRPNCLNYSLSRILSQFYLYLLILFVYA